MGKADVPKRRAEASSKRAKQLWSSSSQPVMTTVFRLSNSSQILYRGQMLNNLAHGQGQLYLRNGSQYVGQFQLGKRHGQGLMINRNSFYCGGWKDGLRSGFGVQTFNSNESFYEGFWQDNRPHGWGRRVEQGRVVLEAMWRKGRPKGPKGDNNNDNDNKRDNNKYNEKDNGLYIEYSEHDDNWVGLLPEDSQEAN